MSAPRPGRGRVRRLWVLAVAAGTILAGAEAYAQQAEIPTLRPTTPLIQQTSRHMGDSHEEDSRETAALPENPDIATGTVVVPQPLSLGDAERYRQIFKLERQGRLREAETQIGWLSDHSLMGHVLAQGYLSAGYRPSYGELSAWLARYPDHPEAARLYAMALSRRPAGAARPRPPEVDIARSGTPEASTIASNPQWQAGLAQWRRGNLAAAAAAFERAAAAGPGQNNDWDRAAAAYWAARAHLRNREPAKVSHWLGIAAQYSRSFYGQLARRALGLDANFEWAARPLTPAGLSAVAHSAAGQRALALLQIGEAGLAEDEMLALLPGAGPDLAAGLHAIAQTYQLPSIALGLGVMAEHQPGVRADSDLYPLPHWRPAGGFTVDRALLFALIRQESSFDADAQSTAGASGLMQLMPATARALGGRPADLRDPAANLALGQEYLRRLLADPAINNNLFLMAVAYNAGPGWLMKWRAADPTPDPLLFIESLSSQETRNFVERVMANVWIYQQRLGQGTPSLDNVAAGAWPIYRAQDDVATASGGSGGRLNAADGAN